MVVVVVVVVVVVEVVEVVVVVVVAAIAQGLSSPFVRRTLPSLPMTSAHATKQSMLNVIQDSVRRGIPYLHGKNIHHTAMVFNDSFETVAQGELADTIVSRGGAASLSKPNPCVVPHAV